jgi:hypothetical protein
MRKIICAGAIVAALTLAGCAGSIIKDKMGAYVGQPASNLFGKLGYPTRDELVAGRKGYIWTTTYFDEGTSYQCKIRVFVDSADVIVGWDYEGNEGGCGRYAATLMR